MRKILGIVLALGSIGFLGSGAEAKASAPAAGQSRIEVVQGRRNDRRRWNNRRVRVVTQVRIVQRGRARFRETYRITYLPNGRTTTVLVSWVRIR